MKKIAFMMMTAAAFIFCACSNDTDTPDGNGTKTGMELRATVEGQRVQTQARASMRGDGEGSANWTFAFDSNDRVNVTNSAASIFYTFANAGDHFTSTDAKTTASPADWYAYFPGNEVSFANQDGTFDKVANCYAMAGKTETATTGDNGLDITMKAQVAVLRVVKVEKASLFSCDINVRTADGKYIAGLTAKKGEAGFDLKTSDTKVSYLRKSEPGVYYIAVPAGVKISIYNGDSLRNTTKDAGLTAGKYYTITTAPTTGTMEATINGKTVQVGWVQLYPGGARIATQNVDKKLTWTEASKTGDDYVWGKNWRTPNTTEMDIVNGDKIDKTTGVENGQPVFVLYSKHIGYSQTKNRVFLHANDSSTESYMEGNYWSTELWPDDKNKGKSLDMLGGNGYFASGGWSKIDITATNYVRPIVND